MRVQYVILFEKGSARTYAADYNWLEKGWAESENDDGWCAGDLTEAGRDAILKHFKLFGAFFPTVEEIKPASPAELLAIRRKIEQEKRLGSIPEPVSDQLGNHNLAKDVGREEQIAA